MKPEKQIIAIAELDGWYQNKEDNLWYHKTKWPNKDSGQTQPPLTVQCGDYLNSRDAIVPVIEKYVKTGHNEQTKFGTELRIILLRGRNEYGLWMSEVICATPSQLSEALLRAAGKWVKE